MYIKQRNVRQYLPCLSLPVITIDFSVAAAVEYEGFTLRGLNKHMLSLERLCCSYKGPFNNL